MRFCHFVFPVDFHDFPRISIIGFDSFRDRFWDAFWIVFGSTSGPFGGQKVSNMSSIVCLVCHRRTQGKFANPDRRDAFLGSGSNGEPANSSEFDDQNLNQNESKNERWGPRTASNIKFFEDVIFDAKRVAKHM